MNPDTDFEQPENQTALLVRESLTREKSSSLLAFAAVCVIAITHNGIVPPHILWSWMGVAAIVILLRVGHARFRLSKGFPDDVSLVPVNIQSVLIFLSASTWSATMYLFDGYGGTSYFFVRMLILASGLAFTTGTLSVFLRTYIAFAIGIMGVTDVILLVRGVDQAVGRVIMGGAIYFAALVFLAHGSGKRFRAALGAQLETEKSRRELQKTNAELTQALERISTLEGILPICAGCKNIRDDRGDWHPVEEFIAKRSNAAFSHALCDECVERLYPEVYEQVKSRKK